LKNPGFVLWDIVLKMENLRRIASLCDTAADKEEATENDAKNNCNAHGSARPAYGRLFCTCI
jgi:hypothetical protein